MRYLFCWRGRAGHEREQLPFMRRGFVCFNLRFMRGCVRRLLREAAEPACAAPVEMEFGGGVCVRERPIAEAGARKLAERAPQGLFIRVEPFDSGRERIVELAGCADLEAITQF